MEKLIKKLNQSERNFVGYGQNPPQPNWPKNAKIALQFVLNYEEGGERCVLDGDESSEVFLSEIINARPYPARHKSMESLYQYGSRAGVWRILRLFENYKIPVTIFAVAYALARNQALCAHLKSNDYDICGHGLRWLDYQFCDVETERSHMQQCIDLLETLLGKKPLGWYTGRDSPNTQKLLLEQDCFLYGSDAYDDDLPYFIEKGKDKKQLIIPYTLDNNDMRFVSAQGFHCGEQFFQYLKDSFDSLYQEGNDGQAKMMSIGMHARILGRPGRIQGIRRFLDYVTGFDDVWFASRSQIAQHWWQQFA